MKIKAKANGEIIDVADDAATLLIDAGIYEAVDAAGAVDAGTTVEPLSTDSMPLRTKRAK